MANGTSEPLQEMNQQGMNEPMRDQQAGGQQRAYGVDEDRLDLAAAALAAAMRRIGNDPTVGEVLTVAQIQALIAIAGELRSIREAGISQGDVL